MLQLMQAFTHIAEPISRKMGSTYSVVAGHPDGYRHLGLLDFSLHPLGDAPMKSAD